MNQDDPRTRSIALLFKLAELTGEPMRAHKLKQYEQALEPAGWASVEAALVGLMKMRKSRDPMPKPSEVLAFLPTAIDSNIPDEANARTAAARIWESLGRFGSYNPSQAKDYIGELGWQVVANMGGWQSLCEDTQEKDRYFALAVWRDTAITICQRARAGLLDQGPAIPRPTSQGKPLPLDVAFAVIETGSRRKTDA